MANPYFSFKQFTVYQDQCAMKVGTDGVLLGAWAPVENINTILDVGTGTGIISLMLAQRSSAIIKAIDIDKGAINQASENFKRSLWKDRLKVYQTDFRDFESSCKFDLIISNPPYYSDSLKPPDDQRSIARHDTSLSFYDLFNKASSLLTDCGMFALILPSDVVERVLLLSASFELYPSKRLDVITSPGKLPKRTMFCFMRGSRECCSEEILIETERHKYSEAYIALTKDFYLKME